MVKIIFEGSGPPDFQKFNRDQCYYGLLKNTQTFDDSVDMCRYEGYKIGWRGTLAEARTKEDYDFMYSLYKSVHFYLYDWVSLFKRLLLINKQALPLQRRRLLTRGSVRVRMKRMGRFSGWATGIQWIRYSTILTNLMKTLLSQHAWTSGRRTVKDMTITIVM